MVALSHIVGTTVRDFSVLGLEPMISADRKGMQA